MKRWLSFFVLVWLIAACNDDKESTTDGGTSTLDGGGGPGSGVQITVYDDGEPQQGVDVVFHDQDGIEISRTQTDADGVAWADAPDGCMVTVARTDSQGIIQLVTILQAKQKDALVVGHPKSRKKVAGKLSISSSKPVANATDYLIDYGCGFKQVDSLDTPWLLEIPGACTLSGPTVSLLVTSRDAQGLPYSYAVAEEITLDPDQAQSVDLISWSDDWATLDLTVKDHLSGTFEVQSVVATVKKDLAYFSVAMPTSATFSASSEALMTMGYPRAFGDSLEYTVAYFTDLAEGPAGESVLFRRDKARPEQLTLQATSELLPLPTEVSVSANSGTAQLSWNAPAELGNVDAILVSIGWTSPKQTVWTLLGPASDTGTLALPVLPDTLVDLAPPLLNTATTKVVKFVDADYINGYDQLRTSYGPEVLSSPFPAEEMTFRVSSRNAN